MSIGKLVAGLVLVGGAGTSVAVATVADTTEADRGVVERVVDGDTVDVTIAGTSTRVRLLNIDTPETKDPTKPVECLGPEATAFLEGLLPAGSAVTLEYDEERIDGYDRTLAGVFTADGTFVNAEVAREGLAAAVVYGDNDRFLPQVEQARDEAVAAGRGLYSPEVACTVPAQVRAVTEATADVPTVDARATSAQLEAGVAVAAGAVASAVGLEQAFADGRLGVLWTALPDTEQQRLAGLVTAGREKAQRDEAAGRAAAVTAREREVAAARAEEERRVREARERAEREEREQAAERKAAREKADAAAAEKAAQRKAARQKADAAAAETAAAQARRKQAEADPEPKASGSGGGSSSGGPAGYTGPRCYAPGGKTWKPC